MQLATQIVASLMALENLNPNEDIKMYINSSGDHCCCSLCLSVRFSRHPPHKLFKSILIAREVIATPSVALEWGFLSEMYVSNGHVKVMKDNHFWKLVQADSCGKP